MQCEGWNTDKTVKIRHVQSKLLYHGSGAALVGDVRLTPLSASKRSSSIDDTKHTSNHMSERGITRREQVA
jgi:hypothetical protein